MIYISQWYTVEMEVRIRRVAKLRNSMLLQAFRFRKGRQGRDPPLLGREFQGLRVVQLLKTDKREWQNLLLFRTWKSSSHALESSNRPEARAHSSDPIGTCFLNLNYVSYRKPLAQTVIKVIGAKASHRFWEKVEKTKLWIFTILVTMFTAV